MILRHSIYRWATLIAVGVATSSCSYLSIYPRDGEIVYGEHDQVPVTVRLEWPENARAMGPLLEVDGVPVPTTMLAYTHTGATTLVYLRPGVHTIHAWSAQFCAICAGGVGQFDATRTFIVAQGAPSPAVSLTLPSTTVAQVSSTK